MPYTLEKLYRIYNDTSGDYIEVSPDGDSLGLVEIKQMELGKQAGCVMLSPEQAKILASILIDAANQAEELEKI